MSAGPSLQDRDPRRATGGRKRAAAGKNARARRGGRGGRAKTIARYLLMIALAAGFVGAAALVGMFSYYGSDPRLPTLKALSDYHPKQVTRIVDRNGVPVGELGAEKRTLVPFSAIPKVLINAVVSAEDAEFFQHAGLNYRGMLRAFIENVLRGRTAQGGSTITQQVVKTFLLSPERTMRRKVQEIILARQLSQKLSKEEVLTLYLNQIYYGHGRYGCEEAARYFFGKSVRDIDTAEAALLAGLPQSPERLSPRKHPEAAKTRQRYVLGRMVENGFLDRATGEKLAAEPIRLAREPSAARGLASEAVDTVARFLSDRGGAGEAGATVETTLDAHLQELARQSLERGLEDLDARQGYRGRTAHLVGKTLEKHLAELTKAHPGGLKDGAIVEGVVTRVEKNAAAGKPGKLFLQLGVAEGVVDLSLEPRYSKGPKPLDDRFVAGDVVRVRAAGERPHAEGAPQALALELGPQAAMVVLEPQTRQILALVGGYDYHPGGFDRSQAAHRQPGSAFKPFVYATAIDQGKITAATLVNDSPEVYDLWKPQNYEKEEFRGPIRVRTALAQSINTVAIKVLSEVGIPSVRTLAAAAGITSPMPEDLGLAMALGAMTVTPLELANAYAAFPSGGQRGDTSLVRTVGGQAIEVPPPQPALKPEVAYIMVSLLRSVIDEGTARAAAGKLRRPAAGKTGTSNGQRDAWFVGFTPDLLAAVWVGFDDGQSLGRGEAGARSALPIWLDFMSKALVGRPTRDFAQPPGVVIQRIDKASGLLPASGQETNTLDEVFLLNSAPTEQAAVAGAETSADKLLLDQ
ncbi:MAG TPA: PBP1A family penicillin-binding protein [Polyangia bacterium]|jgi:penicillin-binding protein 1A